MGRWHCNSRIVEDLGVVFRSVVWMLNRYVLNPLETFKFVSMKRSALIVRCAGEILDSKRSITVEMLAND